MVPSRETALEAVENGLRWHAAYGYEIERIVPEKGGRPIRIVKIKQPEASVVQEIFRLVLDGWSCHAVADFLNARGTPSAKGGKWSPAVVRAIIHNPWYVGIAPWGRFSYVEPAKKRDRTPEYRRYEKVKRVERPQDQWIGKLEVPALVTVEEQERAKECLTEKRRYKARVASYPYQLKNLLRCKAPALDGSGTCDRAMCARTRKYPSGKVRGYYHCGRQYYPPAPDGRRTCANNLAVEEIEPLVWAHASAALQDISELRAAYDRLQQQPNSERQQWEDAIANLHALRDEARKQLRRVRELYENGRYDDDDLAERSAELKPKIAGYDEQIEYAQAKLAQVRSTQIDWGHLESLAARLGQACANATPEQRAEVMRLIVRRVEVWPEKFEIVLGLEDQDLLTQSEPRHQHIAGRISSSPSRSS